MIRERDSPLANDGANRNAAALTKKDGDPNSGAAFGDTFYDELVIGVWKMLSVGAGDCRAIS